MRSELVSSFSLPNKQINKPKGRGIYFVVHFNALSIEASIDKEG